MLMTIIIIKVIAECQGTDVIFLNLTPFGFILFDKQRGKASRLLAVRVLMIGRLPMSKPEAILLRTFQTCTSNLNDCRKGGKLKSLPARLPWSKHGLPRHFDH